MFVAQLLSLDGKAGRKVFLLWSSRKCLLSTQAPTIKRRSFTQLSSRHFNKFRVNYAWCNFNLKTFMHFHKSSRLKFSFFTSTFLVLPTSSHAISKFNWKCKAFILEVMHKALDWSKSFFITPSCFNRLQYAKPHALARSFGVNEKCCRKCRIWKQI